MTAATATNELWELSYMDWRDSEEHLAYSYYAEGTSENHGWFSFDAFSIDELVDALNHLVFDGTKVTAELPR